MVFLFKLQTYSKIKEMKKVLITILLSIPYFVFAQINFNTGSIELNTDLNSINVEAKANLSVFKNDLYVEFNTKPDNVDYLFSLNMQPAEVYLALSIAEISGKSTTEVAEVYKKNKSKGWGYIAKELGIKPGSSEFHELKNKSKNKKEHPKNKTHQVQKQKKKH